MGRVKMSIFYCCCFCIYLSNKFQQVIYFPSNVETTQSKISPLQCILKRSEDCGISLSKEKLHTLCEVDWASMKQTEHQTSQGFLDLAAGTDAGRLCDFEKAFLSKHPVGTTSFYALDYFHQCLKIGIQGVAQPTNLSKISEAIQGLESSQVFLKELHESFKFISILTHQLQKMQGQ